MILHDYKLIYIHVPKTGGRSVEEAFGFRIVPRDPIDRPFDVSTVTRETEKHLPAVVLARSFPDTFRTYFKVGFVRNSWDRIVSAYFWLKTGCNLTHSFKDWVMLDFIDTPPRERAIFIKPCQLDWLANDDGNIIVDYIGRYENLEHGFRGMCERVGAAHTVLPHVNKTSHAHYSTYYDLESQQRIAELYAKDNEFFGFQFESC